MLVMGDFLKGFERPREVFVEGELSRPVSCWCGSEDIAGQALALR
jgi:hypothetical protein